MEVTQREYAISTLEENTVKISLGEAINKKKEKKRTSISTGRFGTGIEKAKQATNGKPKGEQSTSAFRT